MTIIVATSADRGDDAYLTLVGQSTMNRLSDSLRGWLKSVAGDTGKSVSNTNWQGKRFSRLQQLDNRLWRKSQLFTVDTLYSDRLSVVARVP